MIPRTMGHKEYRMVYSWTLLMLHLTYRKTRAGMTWTLRRSMSYAMIVPSSPAKKIIFHSRWTIITMYSATQSVKPNLILILPNRIHVLTVRFSVQLLVPVFKDPNWKLGIIGISNSTYTQVTLSLMHGVLKTTRPINFPPRVSLHIHNKYHRCLHQNLEEELQGFRSSRNHVFKESAAWRSELVDLDAALESAFFR